MDEEQRKLVGFNAGDHLGDSGLLESYSWNTSAMQRTDALRSALASVGDNWDLHRNVLAGSGWTEAIGAQTTQLMQSSVLPALKASELVLGSGWSDVMGQQVAQLMQPSVLSTLKASGLLGASGLMSAFQKMYPEREAYFDQSKSRFETNEFQKVLESFSGVAFRELGSFLTEWNVEQFVLPPGEAEPDGTGLDEISEGTDIEAEPKQNAGEDKDTAAIQCLIPIAFLRAITRQPEMLREGNFRLFEKFSAEAFSRLFGREVQLTGNGSDGGIDIIVTDPSDPENWMLVECKAWAAPVGRPVAQKLVGAMAHFRSGAPVRGAVVTTSHFTGPALNYAADMCMTPFPLEMHDFNRVKQWCAGLRRLLESM